MFAYKLGIFLAIACFVNGLANADEICNNRPNSNPRTCCTFTSKIKEDLSECMTEKRKNKTCATDCLFDALEVFTNNDIDRDVLVSFSTNFLEGEDPSQRFEQTMERCIVRAKGQMLDDTKPKELKLHNNSNCNRRFMKLIRCLNHEVFLNCPVNMWINNENCENWKTFSSKCPNEFRNVWKSPRVPTRKFRY